MALNKTARLIPSHSEVAADEVCQLVRQKRPRQFIV